jgi:hypothetical protein
VAFLEQRRRQETIMTKAMKMVALLGLGLSGLACEATATDDSNLTPDGLPAYTAEERAVVDNMNRNTLAEIELPEGKMKFVEFSPGQVEIMRQFRMGTDLKRIEGEGSMTLEQIFRAYAPEREVPRELYAAMDRIAAVERANAEAPAARVEAARPSELFQGTRLETKSLPSPDGVERVSSTLASTIDQGWFTNAFCRVTGADWSWCYTAAWQGAYASWHTHRSNTVTCGDTGAGRVNFYVGGSLKKVVDVPYGQCWYSGHYHHSHGWFGINNHTDQKYTIPYAASSVRFAGWMAHEDQLIDNF